MQVFAFKGCLPLLAFLDVANKVSRCEVLSSSSSLMSYAMGTPCSSSLLSLARFSLYSKADTFGLNLPSNIL